MSSSKLRVRKCGQLWLTLLGASLAVAACGNADGTKAASVNACVENGIAYYKEIGSYPTLTSAGMEGRLAKDVAAEKCSRSALAFPAKQ
jgi:hypothetical protein